MHPALAFTREDEADDKIPFLDVLVQRSDKSFITSVYRKNTFTGAYMPWNSFCPTSRKTNIVSCLVRRAINICSNTTLDDELLKI